MACCKTHFSDTPALTQNCECAAVAAATDVQPAQTQTITASSVQKEGVAYLPDAHFLTAFPPRPLSTSLSYTSSPPHLARHLYLRYASLLI